MAEQWARDVFSAFPQDLNLQNRILDAAHKFPGELPALFGDIAKYVLSNSTQAAAAAAATAAPQPNAKKRKLDDVPQPFPHAAAPATTLSNPTLSFECKNISFQVPARKKLKLETVVDPSNPSNKEIRLLDPKTNNVDYTLSNSQIDQIFCLPVPDKQQRQWNFCIFPLPNTISAGGVPCEQMVFTLNETKPDDATSTTRAKVEADTYITVTEPELNALIQPFGKSVIRPTDTEFASSIPQPHRKGEKAYHVKAHKGSKEGYLFFLPNGIVFGFKKPLLFFPFSSIESISYTSVLQRTFNLVITATEGDSTDTKDMEFSMLDQTDFAGIDEYIKRHGLNDASMAAQRKAKAYNVNKEVKAETNGDAAEGEDGQTELQKAELQLQEEEDEEEEDYVDDGGESDGSGEDSDEEGDEYGEGYDDEDDEEDVDGEQEAMDEE